MYSCIAESSLNLDIATFKNGCAGLTLLVVKLIVFNDDNDNQSCRVHSASLRPNGFCCCWMKSKVKQTDEDVVGSTDSSVEGDWMNRGAGAIMYGTCTL